MTEINDGDTVRLVFEGQAGKDQLGRVFIGDHLFRTHLAKSVEILERRKPQVGDVLPAGVLRFLPAGTVVLTDSGVAWSKTVASGRWASWFRPAGLTDEEFFRPTFAHGDLTIVYLP